MYKKAGLAQSNYYDYLSDNLAGEVGTPIWRNVLTLRMLRQIYTIPIPARLYVFS